MNAEQVVEMMDAIARGEHFATAFPTAPGTNSISIEVGSGDRIDGFCFGSFEAKFFAKIEEPLVAREIAVALVTWANTRDGQSLRKAMPKAEELFNPMDFVQSNKGNNESV